MSVRLYFFVGGPLDGEWIPVAEYINDLVWRRPTRPSISIPSPAVGAADCLEIREIEALTGHGHHRMKQPMRHCAEEWEIEQLVMKRYFKHALNFRGSTVFVFALCGMSWDEITAAITSRTAELARIVAANPIGP